MRIIGSLAALTIICFPACIGGCGDVLAQRAAPLFTVPLSVNGVSVGNAVVDTGGGYEVMLRERFDLAVVDAARVLAFGGSEIVGVTEGFSYSIAGWDSEASSALVGVSVCDCNGIGFQWFRKTGAVLGIDFPASMAELVSEIPEGGVTIPFSDSPKTLPNFNTSFVSVIVEVGGATREAICLLDTGTTATVMRRELVGVEERQSGGAAPIRVTHARLGSISVWAHLFDTEGLPDIILGTDALGLWADRWYFTFTPTGGSITVYSASDVDVVMAN